MNEQANKNYSEMISEYLKNLSYREKFFITAMVCTVIAFGAFYCYDNVVDIFSKQTLELAKAKQDVSQSSALIRQYSRLERRRASIEDQYKKVKMRERPLSYLEKLAEVKAGISSRNVSIIPKQTSEFGGEYIKAHSQLNFILPI